VGVKEASGNVAHASDMLVASDKSIAFYSGSDEVNVPLMSVGFQGAISVLANVAPKETCAMINSALEGDYQKAGQLQLDYLPLIRLLFVEVNPIPAKAALALMGRITNSLRLPLVPMSQGNQDKLKNELERMGLL
jgi:4-hydroxy-tetrahydrodipicolinate synthase